MASFNKVILIGNLVENPTLNQTPSGVPVASFRIAVSRKIKNKDGQIEADFINIVAWRHNAEFVNRYFSKGKSILVCGQLQSRSWTDKDGNKRSTLEVVADEVDFVEKKANDNTESEAQSATPYNNSFEGEFTEMTADENLPF
jgi:single-strand DNA-binding protein